MKHLSAPSSAQKPPEDIRSQSHDEPGNRPSSTLLEIISGQKPTEDIRSQSQDDEMSSDEDSTVILSRTMQQNTNKQLMQSIAHDTETNDDLNPSTIVEIEEEDYKFCIYDNTEAAREFEMIARKILSFPASLEVVGETYIRPKLVTIGPYYSETEIEENHRLFVRRMKEAAVHSFVSSLDATDESSVRVLIHKIYTYLSHYWDIRNVRSFYDKDRLSLKGYDERDHTGFYNVMFTDGCFLMEFITMCTGSWPDRKARWLENWFDINKSLIGKDIMLLENQLPWEVLKTLNLLRKKSDRGNLEAFVAKMGRTLQVRRHQHQEPYVPAKDYSPPHLLGFLWHYTTGGLIKPNYEGRLRPMSKTMSVIELADIGIDLTCSETTKFKNMGFTRGRFTGAGKISLAPLLLDEVSSSWLINMAAFEVCTATLTKTRVLSSYIALLAMLMDGEQDVHELRAKRLVQGDLTNKETLDFFKTLVKHICPGRQYYHIMEEIESYKVSRSNWIRVHRFLYNSTSKRSFKYNYTKTIMTTVTFVGVIVAIAKVLFFTKAR